MKPGGVFESCVFQGGETDLSRPVEKEGTQGADFSGVL